MERFDITIHIGYKKPVADLPYENFTCIPLQVKYLLVLLVHIESVLWLTKEYVITRDQPLFKPLLLTLPLK